MIIFQYKQNNKIIFKTSCKTEYNFYRSSILQLHYCQLCHYFVSIVKVSSRSMPRRKANLEVSFRFKVIANKVMSGSCSTVDNRAGQTDGIVKMKDTSSYRRYRSSQCRQLKAYRDCYNVKLCWHHWELLS